MPSHVRAPMATCLPGVRANELRRHPHGPSVRHRNLTEASASVKSHGAPRSQNPARAPGEAFDCQPVRRRRAAKIGTFREQLAGCDAARHVQAAPCSSELDPVLDFGHELETVANSASAWYVKTDH